MQALITFNYPPFVADGGIDMQVRQKKDSRLKDTV